MINGIVVELTTDQLRGYLVKRAEYHKSRKQWFLERESQHERNKDSAERHDANAKFFTVIAEHLVKNETYRMTAAEFGNLILTPRGRYVG